MSLLITALVGLIVGALLSALVGAAVLTLATRLLLHFTPRFRAAFAAALFGTLANSALGYAAGMGAASLGLTPGVFAFIPLALVGWLIYAAIVARLIRHPDTGPIGFRHALLISLVTMLLGLLFGVALATVLHLAWR